MRDHAHDTTIIPSLADTTEFEIPRTYGTSHGTSVLRDGVTSGLFAAAGVALAFAVRDLIAGERLFTPALLGFGVGRVVGVRAMTNSVAGAVIGYSVVHVLGFVALATVVAAVVRRARRDASVLAAALLVVAVAELAFAGFVAVLAATADTAAATWTQIAFGNVLGWLLLGGRAWSAHPELRGEFAAAVRGTGQWPAPAR